MTDSRDLVITIPIEQSRTAGDTTIYLTSLDATSNGLSLHGRVLTSISRSDQHLRMVVPVMTFNGDDDRGNVYTFGPSTGQGRSVLDAVEWNFLSLGLGARGLDPAAGELRLVVADVHWRDFLDSAQDDALSVQQVDWQFIIPLRQH